MEYWDFQVTVELKKCKFSFPWEASYDTRANERQKLGKSETAVRSGTYF